MNSPFPVQSRSQKKPLSVFMHHSHELDRIRNLSVRLSIENTDLEKGGIEEAIRHFANNPSPKVLIVDIGKQDFPLDQIDALAEVCSPEVKVIVIGERDSVGLYRSLLDRGVTDYLVRPLPENILSDLLKSLITEEGRTGRIGTNGKTVGIVGACGGAGVTSFLVNAGVFLSDVKRRQVSIVDLNSSSYLSLLLGHKPRGGLQKLLKDPDRLDDLLIDRSLQSLNNRLDLLCSSTDEDLKTYEDKALQKLAGRMAQRRHYVLLDFPSEMTDAELETYCACDVKIILFPPNLRAALKTRDIVSRIIKKSDEDGLFLVLSKTRADHRETLNQREITEVLGRKIDALIPYDGRLFAKAELDGKAIVSMNKKGAELYAPAISFISGSDVHSQKKAFSMKGMWGGFNVWKTR